MELRDFLRRFDKGPDGYGAFLADQTFDTWIEAAGVLSCDRWFDSVLEQVNETNPDGKFRRDVISAMKPRESLVLVPQSPTAIAVFTINEQQLGVLNVSASQEIIKSMMEGHKWLAVVRNMLFDDTVEEGRTVRLGLVVVLMQMRRDWVVLHDL